MAASFKSRHPRLHRVGNFFERLYKARVAKARRLMSHIGLPYRPGGRSWHVDLPLKAVETIQTGALKHTYHPNGYLRRI